MSKVAEGGSPHTLYSLGYKADGPTKLNYTIKYKVTGMGVMSISGKTPTDTSWIPGKEDEKSVEVYTRQ